MKFPLVIPKKTLAHIKNIASVNSRLKVIALCFSDAYHFSSQRLVSYGVILYSVFMLKSNLFKIISVTGAHSSIGKTTLASILLMNLESFGAIKYTKTSLYTSVTDNPDEILQNGKDTAILSESGAEHVFWIQSPYHSLKDSLPFALSKMHHLSGVIVEGNSPVDYLEPDLVIFIVGDDGQIKDSAVKVCRRADILVINSDKENCALPLMNSMLKEKTKVFQIDLINKKGEIDKLLAYIKKYIRGLE